MELPWRYNYTQLTIRRRRRFAVVRGSHRRRRRASWSRRCAFASTQTSGALGCRPAFTAYDPSNAEITKNDEMNPAIGMSHVDLAELAARESMVLLKNENNTLPINPDDSPQHRGDRRQRDVHGSVDARIRAAARSTARSTSPPTSAPATWDRAASSTIRRRRWGPYEGIKEAAMRSGITVTRSNMASAAAAADFVVVVAGLTAGGRGRGVHRRPAIARRGARRARVDGQPGPRPQAQRRRAGRPDRGRRGHGQADGGGARRRQRHRDAVAGERAGGRHGVVPGPDGRARAGQAAVRQGEQLGKAAAVVAGHRQRSAGVRQLHRHHGDALRDRLPLVRRERQSPAAAHGADRPPDGLRLRPVVREVQLRQLAGAVQRRQQDRRRQRHRRCHQHQRTRGRRDRVPVRVVRAHHLAAPAAQGAEGVSARAPRRGGTPPIRTRWTGTPSESRCRCA